MFDISFGPIEVLMLVGAAQGLLLAVGLIGKRSPSWQANVPFALMLAIVAYQLFLFAMMLSGSIIPHLLALTETSFPLTFLIGPLYYLHVRSLLAGRFRFKLYDVLHLGPCLYMIRESAPFWMAPEWVKRRYIQDVYLGGTLGELSGQVLFYIWLNLALMAFYFFLSYWSIRRHDRRLRQASSDAGWVEYLSDLRQMTFGYGIYVLGFGVVASTLSLLRRYGVVVDAVWMLAKAAFLYAIGYQAVSKRFPLVDLAAPATPAPPGRQDELANLPAADSAAASAYEKYRRSGLSADQARHYFAKLCELMETGQAYVANDLRLSTLADQLSVTPNQLSQIINQYAGKTFYEFVNEYRVNHAKRLLKERPETTVLDVALSAGFNNKATFNRVFKQLTRQTPTAFIRQEAEA